MSLSLSYTSDQAKVNLTQVTRIFGLNDQDEPVFLDPSILSTLQQEVQELSETNEVVTNKAIDPALGGDSSSDLKYPSQKAVKTYADEKEAQIRRDVLDKDFVLDDPTLTSPSGVDEYVPTQGAVKSYINESIPTAQETLNILNSLPRIQFTKDVYATTGFFEGVYTTSDIRAKMILGCLTEEDSKRIEPIEFVRYTLNSDISSRERVGIIAQELQKVYPSMVFEDENGMLSVDYVSFLLVKIHHLETQIDLLVNKLNK